MVTEDGRIKLLDFGLARARISDSTQEPTPLSSRFGTKPYMAPERLRDPEIGPNIRSDIVSVGLILYGLLTGRHPFLKRRRSGELSIARSEAAKPLPPKVPASLAKVVQRCLEENPEDRFLTMRKLLAALKNCVVTTLHFNARRTRAKDEPAKHGSGPSVAARIRRALRQIGYHNVTGSRQAMGTLKDLLKRDLPVPLKQSIAFTLRDLIVKAVDFGGEVPAAVREFRGLLLETLIQATDGRLSDAFQNAQLEHLDLYAMDFSGANLSGVSFRGCFLAGARFAGLI
jgi:hypothetical protein